VPKWNLPGDADNLETMLYTRMLLSCLVDADYSVSAWEDDLSYFDTFAAPELNAAECLGRLYAFCNDIRKKSKADGKVNRIRDRVFEVCGNLQQSGICLSSSRPPSNSLSPFFPEIPRIAESCTIWPRALSFLMKHRVCRRT